MRSKKSEKFATRLAHQLYLSVIVIIISFLAGFSLLIAGSFMFISQSENAYNNAIIEQINNTSEGLLISTKNAIRELAYSKGLHDYLTPETEGYDTDKIKALQSFEREANLLLAHTSDIVAIIIQNNAASDIVRGNSNFDNHTFNKNVVIDPEIKGHYFLAPYYDNRLYCHLLPVIMPIYSDYDDEGKQTKLGDGILLLDFSFFYDSVDSLKENASIDLFLIGKKGEVVIGNPEVYANLIAAQTSETGERRFKYNGKKHAIAVRHVDVADYDSDSVYSIVAVLRKSVLSKNIIYLFTIAIACMVPSMAVIFISFGKAKRNIGYSIGEIKEFTKQISEVNFKNRMDYAPNSDYRGIYENINKLLDKYMVISENLVESEKLKNQAELKMLKSQINPHFLFNTLECIRGISAEYGATQISDIAYSMAQILRYSISGGNFSTISQELNIVRDYLRIMTIRTDNKVRFKIDVQEDILESSIIKMALQLMVENCFKHGTKHKNMDEITVLGKKEDDFIVFEISDNGSGLSQEELQILQNKISKCSQISVEDLRNSENQHNGCHGMGLVNIQKRLLLLYGEGSEVSVSESNGGGFKVTLRYRLKQGNL